MSPLKSDVMVFRFLDRSSTAASEHPRPPTYGRSASRVRARRRRPETGPPTAENARGEAEAGGRLVPLLVEGQVHRAKGPHADLLGRTLRIYFSHRSDPT